MPETIKIGSLELRQPYRDYVPALSEDEYEILKADIKAEGKVQQPLLIDDEGNLIDGHHRARIAAELGLPHTAVPTNAIAGLTEDEKVARAVSLNAKRRHLTLAQRRQMAERLHRERGWSTPRIAAVLGVTHPAVLNWLSDEGTTCKDLHVVPSHTTGTDGRDRPTHVPTPEELADRRAQVRDLKASGLTVKQIAAELGVHENTIKADLKAGKMIVSPSAGQAKHAIESASNADDLPSEVTDPRHVHRQARDDERRHQREDMAAQAEEALAADPDPVVWPKQGDFRISLNELADSSVDLILSDPPYDLESLPLYGDLAKHAFRLLPPGGSFIVYAGNYAIPDICEAVKKAGLRYWWTLGVRHASNFASLSGKGVYCCWKPLLWFVKEGRAGTEFVFDLVDSPKPDKARHDWEQAEGEAAYYIERLTVPGQTVLDPMCGSGTVLVAARRLGREVRGFDINPQSVAIARGRLMACRP